MSKMNSKVPVEVLAAIRRVTNDIRESVDLDDCSIEARLLDRGHNTLLDAYDTIVDLLQQRDRLTTDLCELIEKEW